MVTFLKQRPRAVIIATLLIVLIVLSTKKDQIPDEEYQALLHSDKCTLISIEPLLEYPLEVNAKSTITSSNIPSARFLGYVEYGRVQLTGQSAKDVSVVFEDAPSLHFVLDKGVSCFNPRHALEVTSNGHTYDFVICFECGQMEIYKDQVPVSHLLIGGGPDTLNGILTNNHVPLAPY